MRRAGKSLAMLVVGMIISAIAEGQSTSKVGEAERPLRVEVSGGMDRSRGDFYEGGGLVRTAAVAVRWDKTGWGGVRATLHGIQRDVESSDPYSSSSGIDSVTKLDRILALTVSTDVTWRVWRDLTISPSAGAGFAPYAYGKRSTTRRGASSFENYSNSEQGTIWTLGLAMRYRRLVIEKHAIGLLSARNAVTAGREYYPLTIGLRF